MATGDAQLTPNNFLLFGEEGTEIVYSTATITGTAELSVQGGIAENVFEGDAIRTTETELGTEVTVTLFSAEDGDTTTLSLLLPPIRIDPDAPGSTPFKTLAIVTTKRSSIAGPPPGAEFSYTVVPLSGKARVIES
jgi:hypothetical protein